MQIFYAVATNEIKLLLSDNDILVISKLFYYALWRRNISSLAPEADYNCNVYSQNFLEETWGVVGEFRKKSIFEDSDFR